MNGDTHAKPYFLIMPGFGNDEGDYVDGFRSDYQYPGLLNQILKRGFDVSVVPIRKCHWLNICRGLLSPDWYSKQCKPEELFRFYFEAVRSKVDSIRVSHPESKVVFICHSAAGWLLRGLLGSSQYWNESNNTTISDAIYGLVSLGTPHISPSIEFDMTQGAWTRTNQLYPDCFLNDSIFYITVAGTAVVADKSRNDNSIEGFAYRSYKTVRGELSTPEDFVGDGVTPLSSAHLNSSLQVTLPMAYHGVIAPNNMWYGGDDSIIDAWLSVTLETIRQRNLHFNDH